ncbi:MAG: hypothetical protein GVY08_08535 [Bacteroidetes bacterium]|jgi:hypothetical protein|nr:hypothetical protein [Bacteroidota bacterium]
MAEEAEMEYQAWHEDIQYLVHILKESFESESASFYQDEMNNTLYVELEGLDDYSDEEIVEIAQPILEELDLDFEDILLLPLSKR